MLDVDCLTSTGVSLPTRGSAGAAGYDLCAAISGTIPAGQSLCIPTGVSIAIPDSEVYGRIAPRSGLAVRYGLQVLGGVIDSDYRGEIKVILHNLGNLAYEFAAGDRIAQLIFERCCIVNMNQVTTLAPTQRGAGGFGSTGK